jgi:hypothetical protein
LEFWAKTFHCRFSFGGAISTLGRQERDSSGVLLDFLVVLDSILERVEGVFSWLEVFMTKLKRNLFSISAGIRGFHVAVVEGIPTG